MSGFIFGGDTGIGDPAELRRRRDMVDQLLQSSMTRAPQTFGEGLAAIGQALAGRISDKRIREQEEMARDKAQGQFSQITGKLMGSPSQRAMAANGGPTRAAANEMEIIEGLVSRGLPEHVAQGFVKNFRDESGLRTDINEISPLVPGSRGGFGLAQWTGPRRVALEQFAQQRGADVSDINVQLDFLMHELSGPEAKAGQAIMSAQDAPTAADAILRQFLRPAAEHVQTRSARYLGGGGTAMPSSDMVAQLSELAANPYLPEGQRAVVNSMLQTQMQGMDPMRQMQMEQMQLQIEQMRNPQPEQTSGMREYQFAVSQGFPGSFAEWKAGNVPSTNVNVSTGNVPPGYQQITDPETGAIRMEPIPGGPVDREIQEAARGSEVGQDNLRRTGGAAIQDVGRALELLGVDRTIPIAGGISRIRAALGPFVGDYDASNLRQLINSAKSSVSINEIMKMREAGGTLGAIPYQQQQSFERMLGELDADGDPAMLEQNFKRLHNLFWEMVDPQGNVRPEPFELPFDESGFSQSVRPVAPQPPQDMPPPPEGISPEDAELWPYFTDEEREMILRLYRQ